MNKYEKLIEYIISDEEDKARALFHEIVVEKSRDIYESLMDEEQVEENLGGNQVDDLVDEITTDEQGIGEDDEEGEEFSLDGDDDQDGELDGEIGGEEGHEFGGEEEGEGEIEDRVMDLEDAIDELKAEFEKLVGGDQGGEEELGGDEFGAEEEPAGDEFGAEEEMEGMFEAEGSGSGVSGSGASGSGIAEAVSGKSGKSGSATSGKSGKSGASGSGKMESRKSTSEIMREYVDKVGTDWEKESIGAEGHEVGKGGSVANNKQSIVAGKNDMGGTTANIAKGGANPDPSGTPPAKTGGVLKQGGEIDVAKRNVNKPGGNKGAQNFFSKKETSWEKNKGAEGKTTDGSVPVKKDSIIDSKVR